MSSVKQTRSHNGCWTCKRRRRKCDEGRPNCQTCFSIGLVCEGYATRLKWGSGVASRGPLTGAHSPVPDKSLSQRKGRKRDRLKDEKHRISDHHEVSSASPATTVSSGSSDTQPLSEPERSRRRALQKENLFRECRTPDLDASWGADAVNKYRTDQICVVLTTGIRSLQSTLVEASGPPAMLLELSKHSKSLVGICVAIQAYLSYGANDTSFDFYNEVLAQLRLDLDDPQRQQEDGTLVTILLLCSMGVSC